MTDLAEEKGEFWKLIFHFIIIIYHLLSSIMQAVHGELKRTNIVYYSAIISKL